MVFDRISVMPQQPRLQVPYLGEHYADLLKLEAWIKARSAPNEAQSLLCAMLMKREATRDAILQRLAKKRSISKDELVANILADKEAHMSSEEYAELLADEIASDEMPG